MSVTWRNASLLLARVMKTSVSEGALVVISVKELDKNLRMFFTENYIINAYDPKQTCKQGDIVLIKRLDEMMTRKITHEVQDIIYPLGNVTDPITGKKVSVSQYRDDMEETDRMFSSGKGGFTKYITELRKSESKRDQSKSERN